MADWYPGLTRVIDNGYGGTRGGAQITGAVIHHAASTDALGYVAGYNNRSSHPTYYVDKDGKVYGIVHPDRRPFSTANPVDASAVTFEVENLAAGGDWPVSQPSMDAVAAVIAFHAAQSPRAGHPIVKNKPVVTQTGFWVGWHSQYAATACPGPFLLSQMDQIIAKANRDMGIPAPAPVHTPPAAPAHSGPAPLAVDGIWGGLTTAALQRSLGVLADGIIGPVTIKALQHRIGVAADGIIGPITRKALQRRLGTYPDGIWGPITIRALQRRLNAGTF